MRILIALLSCSLSAQILMPIAGGSSAPMAAAPLAYVSSASAYNSGGEATATLPLTVAAGQAVSVFVYWVQGTTVTLSGVSGCGDTFTLANNPTTNTGNSHSAAWAYRVASTGGSCNIVATFSGTTQAYLIGHVVSGVSACDGSAITPQTSPGTEADGQSSGSITTTAAGYIMGATHNGNSATSTTGTGFTARVNDSATNYLFSEDKLTSSAGSVAATFTANPGWPYFLTGIVAFK